MPYSIFQQLVKHPLTDIGLKSFVGLGTRWAGSNS
jgi:hypothetical protein